MVRISSNFQKDNFPHRKCGFNRIKRRCEQVRISKWKMVKWVDECMGKMNFEC